MKQSNASKTLLAIVTILTVMMALIVPSPAYAAKEPPPPPPPPSNDTGGKAGGPSHSAKDLPNDTSVVATNNGTPVSMAAQLTTDSLPLGYTLGLVKFCPAGGGGCDTYNDVQSAIDNIKLKSDAAGILYVASNYDASGKKSILNRYDFTNPLALDQSFSSGWIDQGMDLAMQGGVSFVDFNKVNPANTSTLNQTLNISNINDQSSLFVDGFTFNVGVLTKGSDALSVTNSNNVTLANLIINDSKLGSNGIGVYNSNDITIGGHLTSPVVTSVTVNRSGGLAGDGIHVEDSESVALKDVTVTNTNPVLGNGIDITGSHDISMDNVSATSSKVYGAYLKDNSDGLSITNSTFSNSGYAGLFVTGQTGEVDLANVTADNNGKNVLDIVITPFKFLFPDLASGAAFVDNSGALVINDSQFNGNATAGLWVQNQTGDAPVGDALAELDGNTGFVMLDNVVANGNGVSPCTICIPVAGDIFDYMGWTGGSFIDSDAGSVIVKDSNFSGNTGNGLQTYATDGNLIVKNVTADKNTGEGAILNTFFDLTDGLNYGDGKIIVAGDEPVEDNFSSQFNGNGGTGLEMFAGGFAGVFNSEVLSNFNLVNDSLLDLTLGMGGLPGLEALLLNPGGAFIFSNSPDTVAVANSNFIGNNGEGLAVMTPGDIRVRNVNASGNDGMGAFLDNCLVTTGLQCTGSGTINVGDSEFDSNSYAGLVALASGVEVTPFDTGSVSQGIFLDQVGASGNANFGALLVSPADVVVTNSTFDGSVAVEADGGPTYQQATGLAVLSGGNVYLQSYEDLFGSEGATIEGEDFGVSANGNSGAGAVVLGLGQLDGIGSGSLFSDVDASDALSVNGVAMITSSDFTGNGGDGLTALATLGIGVGNSLFAGNGGNGLTALSLGDIYVIDSGFFDNGGDGAFATSLFGGVSVDPSIFAGNSGNGLTAIAMDNIYIGDSGFFKNGEDGAFVTSLDGNIGVDNSIFARNEDNGLTALSSGGIILGNSGFFKNGEDGAFTTSVLDSIAVVDNIFAGNDGNGLTALSLGDVTLTDSGFFRNGGDGAFVIAALGGIAVDNSLFARNDGNGLTALTLSDIQVGDSGFFGNGGDGAFTTSLFGGTEVLGSNFVGNGENGLTALSLNDIFLGGDFAASNDDNGAVVVSGLGNVGVFESVFGTPLEGATVTSGGPVYSGNGDNGLVVTTLVGDVVLDNVAADQNGDNGIVATSLLGDIAAENVYADQNGIIGAVLASVTGSVDVEDSGFDNNGGVGLVAFGLQDVFMGWSEASGNQYAGATLASLGDVVVTNSDFFGESDFYLPEYAPQMVGLGVVGGDVVLDSSAFLPGATIVDPSDYGVNASGNGVMGALILSASDIQIGDSIFDENGGSVADLGVLSLLGDGVVAVGGLGGNGGMTGLWNTEATGNTSFGAVLFNTDLVGAYLGSAFDNNGLGGLLGVSFGDLELDNIDASGNSLIGAATLSGGYTSVSNSMFDSNLGGAGLLSVAFGPISAENVDASDNGILGAGLVSIDTYDLTDFVASGDSACTEDSMYSGDICVNGMTANNNGFIGAAILGTDWVEVDNSQFTGNDALGSLAGIIPGGGLVVVGGESTVLDQVSADNNFGFGAVVANTGGVYDLLTGMLGGTSSNAAAISQAVTGSATTLDVSDLPLFTDTGDISITNSSFSNNGAFGLWSVSNGDIFLSHVAANGNGTFGATLSAEGNITVNHSTFDHNGTFGLSASIFSPAGAAPVGLASHTVILHGVDASHNGDYGAMVQANTTDKVDVKVTNSSFNGNEGTGTGGLGIFTTGDVYLNHVVADANEGDGADIFGSSVVIRNSHFNFNDGYGIVINSLVHTTITHTNACYNTLGPDSINTPSLFTNRFTEQCGEEDGIGSGPEENPLPWQIIKVMMDPGKNSGTLSCLFGTTFLYLEKQTSPTPDFEWARAVLSACIVPGGSTGTFLGLAEGALPGALPDGITFQGKAFDLSITGPNGQPIDVLGGPMMVRFSLADGFTLPAGKKLDILWWDPAGKKWVELNTYAGGNYAWGFAGNDGTFALAIK